MIRHPIGKALLLALVGSGCHESPSAKEKGEAALATVERCGPGFEGGMIRGGRVIQHESVQTEECKDDKCSNRAIQMMHLWGLPLRAFSCDSVRDRVEKIPIRDAWGAQCRVICGGAGAQAISAGYDGKIGTCDDIARLIARNPGALVHPATRETCGGSFHGQTIVGGEILQRETPQTVACPGAECNGLIGRHMVGVSCGELRRLLAEKPIVDVWGAQTRVVCRTFQDQSLETMSEAEAISAGHDGKLGTCDDVANPVATPEEWIVH